MSSIAYNKHNSFVVIHSNKKIDKKKLILKINEIYNTHKLKLTPYEDGIILKVLYDLNLESSFPWADSNSIIHARFLNHTPSWPGFISSMPSKFRNGYNFFCFDVELAYFSNTCAYFEFYRQKSWKGFSKNSNKKFEIKI